MSQALEKSPLSDLLDKRTPPSILKELLQREQQYINFFFESLDYEVADRLLEILKNCSGTLIFSGIGKSELVAKKIAMTMTSTGSRALFLSPTNALHGDIGIVAPQDVFIMLSKSGESDELLNLIPSLRNKGIQIIGIVSKRNSRLAKACDFAVFLPVEKELCPFDLAPTTSAAVQMIFGDALAVALMTLKEFSLDQYALNHPSGRIGRRITLKVKDLMLTGSRIPFCRSQDKLIDTIVELSNKQCGCVFITDESYRLLGIFTDGDLGRALKAKGPAALDMSIGEFMTRTPRCIAEEALAWKAVELMEADQKHPITVLAVVDEEKKVTGLIKMHDIVQTGLI